MFNYTIVIAHFLYVFGVFDAFFVLISTPEEISRRGKEKFNPFFDWIRSKEGERQERFRIEA